MELAALYRDIVESSPDGMWVFDLEGRTLYANPTLRRMFGADDAEGDLGSVFDTLDDAGRAQFSDHLEDLRQGRVNESDVGARFVRRDGTSLWVLVSETLLRGPDGAITGVLHRLSDDSERQRTLETLVRSERQLSEAQRIARIGSWTWDLRDDAIVTSEELKALYGLDADSSPATFAQFLEIVHEDDRDGVETAVRNCLRDGDEFVFEARIEGHDGWVWSRGRGVVQTDDTGAVVAMSGTHQDITETKQAEIALQDQVLQNQLMQAVSSAANEARTLNEVLERAQHLVLLHDDWERARGFVLNEAADDVVPLYIFDEDRESDASDTAMPELELGLARRTFQEKRAVWDEAKLTIAFPVSYADEVVAVVVITSAPPLWRFELIESMAEQVSVQLGRVAERERVQRELADARDGAMEASRQKSEFLATMSHEIRTPLNGVIGLNDLLLRTRLDAAQLRLASGVQVASRGLLSVINDILDFSKIEAGKLELERLDFEIRPVFDQVASVLAETARAKGLELMLSCHPDVPEVLSGDPTRLAQVLTNLGSNAVKFTETGEVYIRATATPTDEGGTRLHVAVVDTGVGVPEGNIDALFEAFTQADASTTRRYGGTGLGLAISREIVTALDGEIGLEPNPGGGSVFWFTAVFGAPSGSSVDPDDEYARNWLAGKRVLVVDDNAHNRLILEEQLGRWLVRSVSAVSADEAEAAAAAARAEGDPFEGVLLDMSMPHRDGLELAAALRSTPEYAGLPIVMLTSATTPSAEQLLASGVDECLIKPVLATELRAALLRRLPGVEPRSALAPQPAPEQGFSHRILVVEDNPVNQMVAVGLLEAHGYTAETADDGAAALEVLGVETFDAILMDIQMPRLDGYAATRAIRTGEVDGQRIPVIAMTAAAVEGERERCLAAGMDDFLTKPVDPTAMAAVLRHWLGQEAETARTLPVVPGSASSDLIEGLARERLDELRDLDSDNTAYLDRAISNFVHNTPGTLESIRAAVADGDAGTLKQVAHKLAGGALNLGVTDAGRTAQQIELVADTGSTDAALHLVPTLDVHLERGRAALLNYQAMYTATPPTHRQEPS